MSKDSYFVATVVLTVYLFISLFFNAISSLVLNHIKKRKNA